MKWFAALGLAALAACGQTDATGSPPAVQSKSPTEQIGDRPPECPPVDEGRFQLEAAPERAPAGDVVTVSGPIPMFGEDGSYIPPSDDKAVHLWMDVPFEDERWIDLIGPGLEPDREPDSGRYLGSANLTDPDLCTFEFDFAIPEVESGPHSIVALQFGGDGASLYDDAPVYVADSSTDCGKTNITSSEYGTDIHPTSGPAKTVVTLSGTTIRGEDWEWAASDRLEAWWNSGRPGQGLRLVVVHDMERCYFETTFVVPDAPPGSYEIAVYAWEADPKNGYGLFLPHSFTVTD